MSKKTETTETTNPVSKSEVNSESEPTMNPTKFEIKKSDIIPNVTDTDNAQIVADSVYPRPEMTDKRAG